MEDSEIQKRAIKLGNMLVKELGSETNVDMISWWMAYYIAEKMAVAKRTKGDAKKKAEQRCFEAILKLWEHRSTLPAGRRPFESFDPIFRALERLDPENQRPFYYNNLDSSTNDQTNEESNIVQQWLDFGLGIDRVARICLEYVFHQAAQSTTDPKTIEWLENAIKSPNNDDVSIIVRLIESGAKDSQDIDPDAEKTIQEKLKLRIEKLEAFISFSELVRTSYVQELKTRNLKKPSTDESSGIKKKGGRKSSG
jgi:hypothetical protein